MTKEHTPEEIKYRLSNLGVQIGNIAIEYITDLEKENAELKQAEKCKVVEHFEAYGQCRDSRRIAELEEKLKHAEENCINKTCVVFKDKEDCVAQLLELENKKCELLGIIQGKDKVIKDLEWQLQEVAKDNDNYQKENAELKEQLNCSNCSELSEEKCASCAEFSHFKCRSKEQLTKAKELLRYYFDCFKNDNKYTLSDFEVVEDTEQFLNSEVEK